MPFPFAFARLNALQVAVRHSNRPYAWKHHWDSTRFPISPVPVPWLERRSLGPETSGRWIAESASDICLRLHMDFGFMWASSLDYQRPNKANDRVIASWDGYSTYLLIVHEASRYIWVFLTKIQGAATGHHRYIPGPLWPWTRWVDLHWPGWWTCLLVCFHKYASQET